MNAQPAPTLELRGISKSFGSVQALDKVDFEVRDGEVMALVGDNGAGKSTLIKCVAGINSIDTGEFYFDGNRVTIHGPKDAAKLGIEVVYQDLALCDNLDVVQNMYLGREANRFEILREPPMEAKTRQTLSSLPEGYAGSNFASEIMVSSDGKFVYAANRLHDGIAWFSVGADGTLKFAGEAWTRGNYPRSFNFDPTGNFLYSCNQRADAVTVFRVDRKTGALAFTGQYTPVGNPSVIAFLDLGASG